MALIRKQVLSEELFNTHRQKRLKTFKTPDDEETAATGEDDHVPPSKLAGGSGSVASRISSEARLPEDTTENAAADIAGTVGENVNPGESLVKEMSDRSDIGAEDADLAPAKAPARGGRHVVEREKRLGRDDVTLLRITLPYPATGASPTFDSLAKLHDERTALRLVMKKAMADFCEAVRKGKLQNLPSGYPEGTAVLNTTRHLPRDVYEKVTAKLDPMGVTSNRLISKAIARRALAAFIKADRK